MHPVTTLILPGIALTSSMCLDYSNNSVTFKVEDDTENNEIVLTLINGMRTDLCISRSNWPDENGAIHEALIVSLEVDGEYFEQRRMNHGDCFDFNNEGICSHLVEPGAAIEGRIAYTNFNLPLSMYGEDKVLRYMPIYVPSSDECRPEG